MHAKCFVHHPPQYQWLKIKYNVIITYITSITHITYVLTLLILLLTLHKERSIKSWSLHSRRYSKTQLNTAMSNLLLLPPLRQSPEIPSTLNYSVMLQSYYTVIYLQV